MALLVSGAFMIGRESLKNSLPEKEQKSVDIQQLKTELNSVKNELIKSNTSQKSQLENKVNDIENKVNEVANQDKQTIKDLERELKEIKEQIQNDKPGDNPPPADKNQLKLTVYYYTELGQNHMWNDVDTGANSKIVLIDKENSIFPNSELTKKGNNYTITFLPQDAEKYHNQDHVYYFSKNNNKFTLEPAKVEKKEIKLRYVGESSYDKGTFRVCAFNNLFEAERKEDLKIFNIDKNHPQIRQFLNQGKLQENKQFIIRYGKVDEISRGNLIYDFNESNQELEIEEA